MGREIIFACPRVRRYEAASVAEEEFLELPKGKHPELPCSSSTACVQQASEN
jgi:hypothetical protein